MDAGARDAADRGAAASALRSITIGDVGCGGLYCVAEQREGLEGRGREPVAGRGRSGRMQQPIADVPRRFVDASLHRALPGAQLQPAVTDARNRRGAAVGDIGTHAKLPSHRIMPPLVRRNRVGRAVHRTLDNGERAYETRRGRRDIDRRSGSRQRDRRDGHQRGHRGYGAHETHRSDGSHEHGEQRTDLTLLQHPDSFRLSP